MDAYKTTHSHMGESIEARVCGTLNITSFPGISRNHRPLVGPMPYIQRHVEQDHNPIETHQ